MAAGALKKMNADIWSIGNNHIMDAGEEGIISTKSVAKANRCSERQGTVPCLLRLGFKSAQGSQKKALAKASAFFNDVFRFAERDVWLRQVMYASRVMCAFGTSRRNASHHFAAKPRNITAAIAVTSLARQGKLHFFRSFGT